MMNYQPRKANIVANALSQSLRPVAEKPDYVQEAMAQEDVLLLSGSSAEAQAEDLQKWKRHIKKIQS